MRPVRAALEFGMELNADEEVFTRDFNGFHQAPVRGKSGEAEARRLESVPVLIGKLVAVAVALADFFLFIALGNPGIRPEHAGVFAQAQGAALVDLVVLAGHVVDYLVGRGFIEFVGVGVCQLRTVPGVFDHGDLHAQADAEVRDMMLPGVLRGQDHALDSPAAESTGDDHALEGTEDAVDVLLRQGFGVNPRDFHPGIQRVSGMAERLRHGQVGVMQLHVLPHQADLYGVVLVADTLHHFDPVLQVRLRGVNMQFPADNSGKVGLLQHEGRGVEDWKGDVFDDAVRFHVAEVGDLGENGSVGDLLVHPQHDDVRVDSHALQFLDAVLRGLGFVFSAGLQVGYQGDVDIQGVLPADLQAHLADRLDERLALNVADGTADFGDHDIRVGFFGYAVNEALDLIRNMGNRLYGASQVAAFPFLPDDVRVDLAGGQVGVLVQVLIDEPFIVAQVQVGFGTILRDIYLAVLVGAHRTGVYIDIGVQFLGRDLQAAGLQQASEGRCGNALSQSGYHTAGYKDKFRHGSSSVFTGPRFSLSASKIKTKNKGKVSVCTAPLPCCGHITPVQRECQYCVCIPGVLVWWFLRGGNLVVW